MFGFALISFLFREHAAALHCCDCASNMLRSTARTLDILPEVFC